MFGILLLLFTLVPALEFYLLFSIGAKIGAFETFMIIIGTGVVGASLARSQGLAILQKIQNELNNGQLPGTPILHGFLVFGGGLLLLTPGFLTDILGFSMVIPGTRHLIAGLLASYFKRGIENGNIVFMGNINGTRFENLHGMADSPFEKGPETLSGGVYEAEFERKDPSQED